MIKERDDIAANLQAEPDEHDPEAALNIAVALVSRHGELEAQISQLEVELTRRTDELAAALDAQASVAAGGAPRMSFGSGGGKVGRVSRISWAPEMGEAMAPEAAPAGPEAMDSKMSKEGEDCSVQ